ncbi:MAG: hypothetical protein WDZ51_11125 [Pirellulaceae bacterium]
MTFLLNEESLHGQFETSVDFVKAVETIMLIRECIRRSSRELSCHRSLANAKVTDTQYMAEAIQAMSREKRLAWTQWVSRAGPFWLDDREHTGDDWMETTEETIVTNTAIGESAFCIANELERHLVSLTPSKWMEDQIAVTWVKGDEDRQLIVVPNHISRASVADVLATLPALFNSWESLGRIARDTFSHLMFADDAFEKLRPHPYHQGAAERLYIRLNVLDQLSNGFDQDGNRTSEADRLLAMHFTGEKAWFTDSSDSEKSGFASQLSFRHPSEPGKKITCTWHGKVKTPQLRIHFSWPITADISVYIPYVGPKLTKK